MKLKYVTITGADDKVDTNALNNLSEKYPFVEWGILFSNTREGLPRYPSKSWVLPKVYSCHLCGQLAKEAVGGHDPKANRIQLNGVKKIKKIHKATILQVKSFEEIFDKDIQMLYDLSCGKGIEANYWPKPREGVFCGYAGGFNPNNLEDQLKKLNDITDKEIWIDMETGVRTDDQFDLEKVERVLGIASKYK